MIKLTGLNEKEFYLNCSLIEKMETVPETLILLTNGKRIMVKDELDDVIEKIISFKRRIHNIDIDKE